ncbi:MAG: SDR family NAD(P)-dependent oxidoreductase, partial [Pseudomonadota bacterium]
MKLLIFGYGFTAQALVEDLRPFPDGSVRATTRSATKAEALTTAGVVARIFPGTDMADDIAWASHILISAGPEHGRDPVLAHLRAAFATARPDWLGYLSTTGVYGDHAGAWVDETTPLTPATERGRARIAAEAEWMALHRDHGLPVHIFR